MIPDLHSSFTPGFERAEFRVDRVRPRRVAFDFPHEIPRLWVGGSAARTHLLNSLHLFLPALERMIIRNFKEDVLPRIADGHLRLQAQGLIAQEALHAKAHSLFLRNLAAQGYAIDGYLRMAEWFFGRLMARRMPARLVLASIAAFEHYTDLLVELIADTDFLEACEPRMRELILWHAAEEVEHHAIPFLLLQRTGAGALLRLAGNLLGLAYIFGFMMSGTLMLLWQDGELSRMRAWRELGGLFFTKYGMARRTWRLFARYVRPSYDPNEIDRCAFARSVLELPARR